MLNDCGKEKGSSILLAMSGMATLMPLMSKKKSL
jgi:hypothetical protein